MAGSSFFMLMVGIMVVNAFPAPAAAEQRGIKHSAQNCEILLRAEAQPLAMVALTLNAECMPNETIVLHHNGLIFSQKTNGKGSVELMVPALARKAIFVATFETGDGALTMIDVPGVDQYHRIALQWHGAKGLQLHAYEAGAQYGSEGHVWSQSAGGHSFSLLGDSALVDGFHAEVASFPTAAKQTAPLVSIDIEAQVSEKNCDRNIAGELIQLMPDKRVKYKSLTLFMPDCSAVGEVVIMRDVVKNFRGSLVK